MKGVELFWNILYYFVYKADYKFHLFISHINPFMLIHKLPFQKKMYEKRGIDIYKDMNTAFEDPENGLSSIRSGAFMTVITMLLALDVFCLIQAAHGPGYISIGIFVIVALPLMIFHYLSLFYKDKYLDYFRNFNARSEKWKRRWAWISFGSFIAIFCSFVVCYNIMSYSIHH